MKKKLIFFVFACSLSFLNGCSNNYTEQIIDNIVAIKIEKQSITVSA